MSDFDIKEKRFEQDIEEYLITYGATRKATPSHSTANSPLTVRHSSLSSKRASPLSGRGMKRFTAAKVRTRLLSALAGK